MEFHSTITNKLLNIISGQTKLVWEILDAHEARIKPKIRGPIWTSFLLFSFF
jgi:hypothetical protein